MSVRFVGPYQTMGPVKVDSGATIARGDFVTVAAGLVTAIGAAANANLAVALDSYPDSEYEGTKEQVALAYLGEDAEIEVPFTKATPLADGDIGGGPFALTAAGEVDLAVTVDGVFIPRRLGRDTEIGDTSGYLVGVVLDAASL